MASSPAPKGDAGPSPCPPRDGPGLALVCGLSQVSHYTLSFSSLRIFNLALVCGLSQVSHYTLPFSSLRTFNLALVCGISHVILDSNPSTSLI